MDLAWAGTMQLVHYPWKIIATALSMITAANTPTLSADPALDISVEVLLAPSELMPGVMLNAYVKTYTPITEIEFVVELADGTLVTSYGFAVQRESSEITWAALIGIPSTAPPAPAQLTISGQLIGNTPEKSFHVLHQQSILIHEREFTHEEIPLSTELSYLRSNFNLIRKTESQALWRLLTTSRPVAWPHFGPLQLPLEDFHRTSAFGDRRLYRYADGSTATAIHNGVDFGAPTGTDVFSSGGGKISMASERIITGFTVVIEHLPGLYSLYYHLDSLSVREGQRVSQGDRIGTVGSTGLATGPHLHWEVRSAGVAVDPDLLVKRSLIDLPNR